MTRFLHTLCTIAAGVWLGGMILIAMVAMNTFRVMRSLDVASPDAFAGRIMAENFASFDKVQLICAAVLLAGLGLTALIVRWRAATVVRLCLAIAATGVLVYSVQFLTPRITALQADVAAAQSDSEVRRIFEEFHASAVTLSRINLALLSVLLVSLAWSGAPLPRLPRDEPAAHAMPPEQN